MTTLRATVWQTIWKQLKRLVYLAFLETSKLISPKEGEVLYHKGNDIGEKYSDKWPFSTRRRGNGREITVVSHLVGTGMHTNKVTYCKSHQNFASYQPHWCRLTKSFLKLCQTLNNFLTYCYKNVNNITTKPREQTHLNVCNAMSLSPLWDISHKLVKKTYNSNVRLKSILWKCCIHVEN